MSHVDNVTFITGPNAETAIFKINFNELQFVVICNNEIISQIQMNITHNEKL